MTAIKLPFKSAGTNYILWGWKGNYLNLGAGAELGIYYGGPNHWYADKNLKMKMFMKLMDKKTGKIIISHNAKTWWITGFNHYKEFKDLTDKQLSARFVVLFDNKTMFKSFRFFKEKSKTTTDKDEKNELKDYKYCACFSYNNAVHITF